MFSLRSLLSVTAFLLSLSFAVSAHALVVAYEWNEGAPGTNSLHQSRHGVGGPVLADDFTSAVTGRVARIEWWGSQASSTVWEVTFHNDAGGFPADTDAGGVNQSSFGGISQHFVNATGIDPDGDGVFEFSASWIPQDVFLTAGTDYWFSTANNNPGWLWADAGGPSPLVGTEQFTAVESTGVGPNGGPHFGPWIPLANPAGAKQDFAFRILVDVPEPSTMAVFGLGLLGLGFVRRRRTV
jgi:PEP-CTERM motif-containing protein